MIDLPFLRRGVIGREVTGVREITRPRDLNLRPEEGFVLEFRDGGETLISRDDTGRWVVQIFKSPRTPTAA